MCPMIGPDETPAARKTKLRGEPKPPTLDDPVHTHWAVIPSAAAAAVGLFAEIPALALVGAACALAALVLRSHEQTRQVLRQIRDGQSNPPGQSTPS